MMVQNLGFGESWTRKHGRGWEGGAPESDAASDAVDRESGRVWVFFFFFFLGFEPNRLDSRRCGSIRAESASIRAESGWFGPNRADSARIGSYRPYRVVSTGDRYGRYGRNGPETAEIGRKMPKLALKLAGAAEIPTSDVFFAFFFLCFMNQVY